MKEGVDELTDALGGYPLALAFAAAVITRERLGCHEYLRRLSALPLDAALAPHEGDPYPEGIGEAIRLSLDAVARQAGQARELAELIAVLSPAGVVRSLLVPDDVPEAIKAARSGVLGLLADVSLISFSQDGQAVIMHRLTRRTVREYAARHRRLSAAVAQAIALLEDRLQTAEPAHDELAHAESLPELADEPALHRDCLADLLNFGEQTVAAYSKPTIAAYNYVERGEVELLNRALLSHQQRVLGPYHPATLRSRAIQAADYRAAGKVDEAIDIAQQTLAQQERVLGTDHPDTLNTRFQLVISYTAAGRSNNLIKLLEQTITAQERVLGKGRWETLRSRTHLAWVSQSLGWMGAAVELGEHVVADCGRLLGHGHPESLSARMDLGCIYRHAGEVAQSTQLLEQNVADGERIPGASSSSVQALDTRSHLAGGYRAAGRSDEASYSASIIPTAARPLTTSRSPAITLVGTRTLFGCWSRVTGRPRPPKTPAGCATASPYASVNGIDETTRLPLP